MVLTGEWEKDVCFFSKDKRNCPPPNSSAFACGRFDTQWIFFLSITTQLSLSQRRCHRPFTSTLLHSLQFFGEKQLQAMRKQVVTLAILMWIQLRIFHQEQRVSYVIYQNIFRTMKLSQFQCPWHIDNPRTPNQIPRNVIHNLEPSSGGNYHNAQICESWK